MTRRSAGEGSVYLDKRSGLWVSVVSLDPSEDGIRRRKYFRAKTKREALARMDEFKTVNVRGTSLMGGDRSLREYLHWWLSDVLPGRVKRSTATDYEWILAAYVEPAIGHIKLTHLSPADIQTMMRKMETRGLSSSTIRLTRSVLRRALGTAEKWGYLQRNPAALVDPPRSTISSLDDLSATEARALLQTVSTDPLSALAEIAIGLGLRQGEILALRWEDIDLENRTLQVRHTLKRPSGGGWYLDVPKTPAAVRSLPLTDRIVTALRQRRIRQAEDRLSAGPMWVEEGFVFTSSIGTPLNKRNVLRWWHDATERSGIGRRRFHASRHTAATLMLEAGVPLEVISRMLGHSSLAVTADVYARVKPQATRSAADSLGRVLNG